MGIRNWIPNNSSLLCSEHFEQTCFNKRGKYLILKDRSIPTIFKVEYFNNVKSAASTSIEHVPSRQTEFSQKLQFNDNIKFDTPQQQQTSCNELRNQIQTHLADQNIGDISINKNMSIFEESFVSDEIDGFIDENVHKSISGNIINVVNQDHRYYASPSTLHKKLIKTQEVLKNKERIIKRQNRQLQCLQTND